MAAAPQTDANAAPGQETAPARNADVARALRWYVLACAGASAAIGAAGLLAWHARLPLLLLTWWGGGTALHYNTAVLLVLASASLVASVQQRRVLCGGLGLVVAVAAALILVNELLWLHWGLNELLFRVSAGPVRVASTRVAPNTAVALFAAGLAMLWTIAPRVLRWRGVAIAGLGSLVAIVATVSLVGYAFSIHAAYRWRAYNAMSLPAAVAIAFLGLALVLTGRLQAERDAMTGPPPLTLFLGVAFPVASLLAWQALDWQRDQAQPGSALPEVILGMALAISAMAVLSVWLAQVARQRNRSLELSARAVAAERQRLHAVLDMLPAYVVLLSPDYHVPFANRFFEDRFGKSAGRRCYEYLFQRDTPCENCESYTVATTRAYHHWEWLGPDDRNYDIHDFPFHDHDGSPLIMEVGLDVTERKAAEEELRRSNRSLRLICECNQLLVHAQDEQELVERICELAVEQGACRVAWVGYAQSDSAKTIRCVAVAGAPRQFIDGAGITWSEEPSGAGPTGTAIRTGEVQACDDLLHCPCVERWRERLAAQALRSLLVLPLSDRKGCFGVLSLYSGEVAGFSADESKLLQELANDLAYGIASVRAHKERERGEEQLRRSEERYRSLARATSQVVWTTDAEGMVCGPMPSWSEFSGRAAPELQGWGWIEDTHPQDRARIRQAWEQATATRGRYELEYRLRRHDGQYRDMWVRGVPIQEEDGSVREWVGACTDITDRKRAEEELRRSRQRLQLHVQRTPLAVIEWSTNFEVVEWNPGAEAMFGYSRQEAIGLHASSLVPPASWPAVERVLCELAASRGGLRSTNSNRTRDGRTIECEWYNTPLIDERGEVIGMASLAQDVTERKRAEQLLDEQQFYTRSLIEASLDPLMTTDEQGRITDVNREMERLTGQSREQVVGTLFSSHCTDPVRAHSGVETVFAQGQVRDFDLVVRSVTGRETEVSYNATTYRDRKGKVRGLFAAARNITERKRAEEQLHRYAAELERSNSELQDFASIASHDLQEPLRKVLAFGDRLRDHCGGSLDETGQDCLRRMQGAAGRMSQLIESLLEYSRVTSRAKPFARVDLTQTMFEVVANLEARITASRARVSFDILPVVRADSTQMRQLFQNLLGNALKFQPPGRRPEIEITASRLPGSRSTADGLPLTAATQAVATVDRQQPALSCGEGTVDCAGAWEIRVSDNGIGFDDQYAERIFRPFQRLHGRQEFEGSGMGLAICRKIVQRHGGALSAHSRPGEGSEFVALLPDDAKEKERERWPIENPVSSSSPKTTTTITC